MCRLFAYSGPARDLGAFLVGPGSLEALACEHGSGWGLATWPDGLRIRKEPVAADDPKSGWRAAVDEARAPLVLAHIRKASVGRVSFENTHPFAFGRWAFAHNGTVQGLDAARDRLIASLDADLRANVHGATDSELLAHLFFQRLRRGPAGLDATPAHAARVLADTSAHFCRAFPGSPATGVSKATFLASDGRSAVGVRRGRELAWLQGEGWAIVASEPVGPRDGWREFRDGDAFVLADGRVRRV